MAWKTNTEPKIFLFHMFTPSCLFRSKFFRIVTLVHCKVWLSITLELSKVFKSNWLAFVHFWSKFDDIFCAGSTGSHFAKFP